MAQKVRNFIGNFFASNVVVLYFNVRRTSEESSKFDFWKQFASKKVSPLYEEEKNDWPTQQWLEIKEEKCSMLMVEKS